MEINAYMNRWGGEQYVTPRMKVVVLSTENTILTSCTAGTDGTEGYGQD